jgi:hypothetical protein
MEAKRRALEAVVVKAGPPFLKSEAPACGEAIPERNLARSRRSR